MNTSYWLRVIIAFDIFMNTVLGGRFGETISARVGLRRAWYDCAVADILNWIQKDHTTLAREHDQERDIEALRDLAGEEQIPIQAAENENPIIHPMHRDHGLLDLRGPANPRKPPQ